jgi:hypothetical protein
LIKSEFGITPNSDMSQEEFEKLAADALWLIDFKHSKMRQAVAEGALEAYTQVMMVKNQMNDK